LLKDIEYAIFCVENVGAIPGPTGSEAMRSPDFGTYKFAVAVLKGNAARRMVSGLGGDRGLELRERFGRERERHGELEEPAFDTGKPLLLASL
jgi:hypothetical protein